MTSIRRCIDLVESAQRDVSESVETIYTRAEGKVVVLRNPSVAELLNAARRKTMRGLVDRNGDAYWWPGSVAIHASVANALGLLFSDIYKPDGIARTMIRGRVLDIISGWKTAMRSREIALLTNNGVGIKWGKDTLTMDEFVARLREMDRLNDNKVTHDELISRFPALLEIAALPKYDTKAKAAFGAVPALDLSDREREAVEWYAGHGHTHVNSKLRGTTPEWDMPSKDEMWDELGFVMDTDEAIEHLDQVIAKAPPRKRPLTVFRGERDPTRMAELEAMEPGDSFTDTGYLSTSLGPSYAFYAFAQRQSVNALSMFIVPPSVPGVFLNVDGNEPSPEMEFLIGRGVRYTLREKRIIPNRNRGHPAREILLLVWDTSR